MGEVRKGTGAGKWDGGAVREGEGADGCAMGGRLGRRGGGGPSVL